MNRKEINEFLENDNKKRQEAIVHIIASSNYWKGDTIDNSYYPNNLGLERAFEEAVSHVKRYHYEFLTEQDIQRARKSLKLSKENKK